MSSNVLTIGGTPLIYGERSNGDLMIDNGGLRIDVSFLEKGYYRLYVSFGDEIYYENIMVVDNYFSGLEEFGFPGHN